MIFKKSISPSSSKIHVQERRGERSFSLLETIVAVSLVAVLMVEVSGVHGNSIAFNEYGRKVLQASYLAKRMMSQVEYQSTVRTPIKDLGSLEVKDQVFEDAPDFSYSLSLKPLPKALDLMIKIFSGGMVGKDDSKDEQDKDNSAGAIIEQMKSVIEQAVGDEPIWLAKVEVTWPEGARRGSTQLAMILTDIKRLEDSVGKLMDAATVPVTGPTNSPQTIPTPAPTTPGVPSGT